MEQWKNELYSYLGNKVSVDDDSLFLASFDISDADPHTPSAIVQVTSVEDIITVLRIANHYNIPVTPRCYNLNVAGLAIPSEKGILLDLSKMNKILGINTQDMSMVIEPGVTQAQIRTYLEENANDLTIGYSLAPPDTSVCANCLMDGLTNLSLRYGSMAEWILGLEVVLSDGTVVKTGSWALVENSFGRPPLPDLTGLFVGFQATTGIVTKLCLALWPKKPFRRRMMTLAYDCKLTFEVVRRLCYLGVCDDIGVLSWPTGHMMLGVERPYPKKPNSEPDFFLYLDIGAFDQMEMTMLLSRLENILKDCDPSRRFFSKPILVEDLAMTIPAMRKFAEFPTELDFLTKTKSKGLSWVGTYGPLSKIHTLCSSGMELMTQHHFPPTIVSRPMKGGHFAVLRFIEIFNKNDPSEITSVRNLNKALFQLALDHGFIQYKPPVSIMPELLPRLDQGFLKTMKAIRVLLDPQNILNKGKLEL